MNFDRISCVSCMTLQMPELDAIRPQESWDTLKQSFETPLPPDDQLLNLVSYDKARNPVTPKALLKCKVL